MLASAQQSSYTNQKDYVENEEIFTWLTKDTTNILTTLNDIGGYFDSRWVEGKHGDLLIETRYSTSSTEKFDMSEMTPELWASIDKANRDYIEKTNAEAGKTVETVYYRLYYDDEYHYIGTKRAEKIGLLENGYDYAYVAHDKDQSDFYIWISKNAICCDESIIEGDFSEQYAATEKAYKEAHSAAPTDEKAEAETEKVAGE